MSNNTHHNFRLSSHSEGDAFHEVELNFPLPASNKFGFTWPGNQDGRADTTTPRYDPSHDCFSVNVTSVSDEPDSPRTNDQDEIGVPGPSDTSRSSSHIGVSLPRLSRAYSMPLTSQIFHLQHPSRSLHKVEIPAPTPYDGNPAPCDQHFQELALELADSAQIAIQTLLQLSPPHLFDPAKEQFSACTVQIPTPSLSALLTSMKNLNYISANMRALGYPPGDDAVELDVNVIHDSMPKDEFDIGEVLQSVGDSLGGIAAEAEVDLVLHHGDGIKHMGVRGDECGISYALSHIIHQVLMTARPGDSMDIGLGITGHHTSRGSTEQLSDTSSYFSRSSATGEQPTLDTEGSIVCTFDIGHRFSSISTNGVLSENSPEDSQFLEARSEERPSDAPEGRPEPQFDSQILRRLLKFIGGTLRTSLPPRLFRSGRRCELSLSLECGPSLSLLDQRSPLADDETYRQPFSDIRLAREPSIEDLTNFAETLRGKNVAFHASSQGSFAHHLTRYLTAWGLDISHVPTDGLDERDTREDMSNSQLQSQHGSLASSPGVGIGISNSENEPPIIDNQSDAPSDIKPTSNETGLSLIIIDDNVQGLRRRLLQHRAETMPNLQQPHSRKRPSLAPHHRPRSSPSVRNALLTVGPLPPPSQQQSSPPSAFSPVPIVHFTSLANYKLVRDAIQATIISYGSLPSPPEVIVIPKPAGPRRILTALHTAIHRPYVDPFFSPIATSPTSPGGTIQPFLAGRKSTSASTPPVGYRSGIDRLPRIGPDSASTLPPSSPRLVPDAAEYFSDAAVRALGGNAASGLVIQSPDGRPAGIFFQPQSRMSSSKSDPAMMTMERDRTARPACQRASRRTSSSKTGADNETSKQTTPMYRSPCAKPLLDRTCYVDQTELLRSYKGKGRLRAATVEQEECRALTSAAWREATQNLAKQSMTPTSPLDSNPVSAISTSITPSPITDSTSVSPTRLTNNTGTPVPLPRSATSSTSSKQKKFVVRRVPQGAKSPVHPTSIKKSKTVGNNIVPPISVLIVEDNAINQTILSTFMRRNKIKYEVAWNGREAVEKWRNGNFHLILMDIQMPVMDGIEATKEIRRLEKVENIGHFPSSPGDGHKRSAETPDSKPSSTVSTPFRSQVIIVALTASSLQSDRVAALAAGCNDFLTKPVTNSWLNDKIIEWGSIKALQMWAELRPEIAKNINHDQAVQAQAVANNLYVPFGPARGSPLSTPLRDTHIPMSNDTEFPEAEEAAVSRRFRNICPTGAKANRRSSQGSLSSDSSPERWPLSSDDDFTQDPITEPPAVIVTPIRSTIELPPLEDEPVQVASEKALHYLEDSKQDSQLSRPVILGQRAMSSATSSTSIAAELYDTPDAGDVRRNSLAVARNPSEN